jgi:hypothetical protein
MINLQEEDWFIPGVKQTKVGLGESAKQIAVVLDGQVAFFIGVKEEIAEKLINGISFSECEAVNGLFCLSFISDGVLDQILCNEMTQAALLSNPQLVYVDKAVQRHAELAEVGWLYVDDQFIVPGVYE